VATGEEDCGQRVDAEIVALQSIEVEVVVLVGSRNEIGLAVAVHKEGRVRRLIARDAVSPRRAHHGRALPRYV